MKWTKMVKYMGSSNPDLYWGQLTIFLILVVMAVAAVHAFFPKVMAEGFRQETPFVLQTQSAAYDRFYADVYAQIHPSNEANAQAVVEWVQRETQATPEYASMLDVGCGQGDLLVAFANKGFRCVGIDSSQDMADDTSEALCGGKRCKTPGCSKRKRTLTLNDSGMRKMPGHCLASDVLASPKLFEPDSMTHVLCVGPTTLYEICPDAERLSTLLAHVRLWLKRGGALIMQIDPLPSHPNSRKIKLGGGVSCQVDSVPLMGGTCLRETFVSNSLVRQNEWLLKSPFHSCDDWVGAICSKGFALFTETKLAHGHFVMFKKI